MRAIEQSKGTRLVSIDASLDLVRNNIISSMFVLVKVLPIVEVCSPILCGHLHFCCFV